MTIDTNPDFVECLFSARITQNDILLFFKKRFNCCLLVLTVCRHFFKIENEDLLSVDPAYIIFPTKISFLFILMESLYWFYDFERRIQHYGLTNFLTLTGVLNASPIKMSRIKVTLFFSLYCPCLTNLFLSK